MKLSFLDTAHKRTHKYAQVRTRRERRAEKKIGVATSTDAARRFCTQRDTMMVASLSSCPDRIIVFRSFIFERCSFVVDRNSVGQSDRSKMKNSRADATARANCLSSLLSLPSPSFSLSPSLPFSLSAGPPGIDHNPVIIVLSTPSIRVFTLQNTAELIVLLFMPARRSLIISRLRIIS